MNELVVASNLEIGTMRSMSCQSRRGDRWKLASRAGGKGSFFRALVLDSRVFLYAGRRSTDEICCLAGTRATILANGDDSSRESGDDEIDEDKQMGIAFQCRSMEAEMRRASVEEK